MLNNKSSMIRSRLLTIFTAVLLGQGAWGQTFKVIHSFGNTGDGISPQFGQVFDNQGNLYGVTDLGPQGTGCLGNEGCGTVYQLKPNPDGTWTETVIQAFNGNDGAFPASSLMFDSQGNLYGSSDGEGHYPDFVYKLTPGSNGGWTESTIYQFSGPPDGSYPGELTLDTAGNIYGTTRFGGVNGTGTVFSLNRSSGWQESILLNFAGYPYEGGLGPVGAITLDANGNLYGTTLQGGTSNSGLVYKLTEQGDQWQETVLYNFAGGSDGAVPLGVIFGADGSLYGVTQVGGKLGTVFCELGCGTVFKLTPQSNGTWTKTVLYAFSGGHHDGANPAPHRVAFDQAGNLYGVTSGGGNSGPTIQCGIYGCGTVFKLTPSSNGQWTESIVHSFTGAMDGFNPDSPLTIDQAGNLYGTAADGGLYLGGVAYEITP